MIKYEPGSWGLFFALQCHGSVFPKSLVIALPVAILCMVLHVGVREYTDLLEDEMEYAGIALNVLNGFTSILGFLIVFRSQQAYSRWWEGGTLLQQIRGEWFNAYSSLLAFCNADPNKAAEVTAFQHKLIRLFSMQYSAALEQVTTEPKLFLGTIELNGFELDSLYALKSAHDKCEVVLQWIQREIVVNSACKVLLIEPPILSRVYNQLGNGIVMLNNARKITEFPIPFPLAQMVTCMLCCHWFITLFFCIVYVASAVNGALICFLVVFSFWSINFISLELEMPFGADSNDLPLEEMQADFNASLVDLLQPKFFHCPHFEYNAENHKALRIADVNLDHHIDQLLFSCRRAVSIRQLEEEVVIPAAVAAVNRTGRKAGKQLVVKEGPGKEATRLKVPDGAPENLARVVPSDQSARPPDPAGRELSSPLSSQFTTTGTQFNSEGARYNRLVQAQAESAGSTPMRMPNANANAAQAQAATVGQSEDRTNHTELGALQSVSDEHSIDPKESGGGCRPLNQVVKPTSERGPSQDARERAGLATLPPHLRGASDRGATDRGASDGGAGNSSEATLFP